MPTPIDGDKVVVQRTRTSSALDGPVLALLAGVLPILLAVWVAVTENDPFLWVMLVVIGIAVCLTVCFFFPDQTVLAYAERRRRRVAIKTGYLRLSDVDWLIAKHLRKTVSPTIREGLRESVQSRLHASNHVQWRRLGLVMVKWLRRRQSPTLLRDALLSGITVAELDAHLNGDPLLDHEAIATLAGLIRPDALDSGKT